MSCSPFHSQVQKNLRRDPRKVQRAHRWRHGHDPADPDTHPDSGWTYLTLDITEHEDSPPDQRRLLTGGPESGVPCHICGQMTHIAGSMTKAEMLTQPGVEVVNKEDVDWEAAAREEIVILACPADHFMQWRREFLPQRRQQ